MKMETVKIYQTVGSNRDLLSMRTFKSFTVAVYDFWMSECIKANRRTPAEQAKLTKRGIADYWGTYETKSGVDLQQMSHVIYPDGAVSTIRDARYNFRKQFLASTKYLSTLVVDTGEQDQDAPKYVFDVLPELIDGKLYPKFAFSLVQRIKAPSIPSPLEVPVVLYRPLRRTPSAMSFIMNRRLIVHWKMNVKRNTVRTTVIPQHEFIAWFHLEDPKKWSSHRNGGGKDGHQMWLDRLVRAPVEAYGLFSFDGLINTGSWEPSIQITKLW